MTAAQAAERVMDAVRDLERAMPGDSRDLGDEEDMAPPSSNFTPGKGSAQAAGKLRRPPPGGVEREPVPRRSESAQLLVEKK